MSDSRIPGTHYKIQDARKQIIQDTTIPDTLNYN